MRRSIKPHSLHVDYLSRVEGETALTVRVGEGDETDIKLKIFEPPRFFESFLVGRRFDEVGDIVSRICGICPISHMTTSLQAVEDAMGIDPGSQTKALRRLMCVAQIVSSHIVHLYMLALPDYFNYPGFLPMMSEFKEETRNFLRMKEVMNRVGDVIGGRALHPVSMVVGGFTRVPSSKDLDALAVDIEALLPLARNTCHLINDLTCPDLESNTEYVGLQRDGEFAINEGKLVSSKGLDLEIHRYASYFKEKQESYAMAKKSFTAEGSPFMVGALARMNLKFDCYHQETRALAGKMNLSLPDCNPFHNNLAQALEIHDGMLECLSLISGLNPQNERASFKIREGAGRSITEAPRGLLMHYYEVDRRGFIGKANLVTPTSHNFANMEEDLRLLVNRFSEDDGPGLRKKCEQLIRAYDPCFSCSVH
ncbi:MAG: Ni/Fe hydrogenase subunit alpha [Desulfatiglandales bacterium]